MVINKNSPEAGTCYKKGYHSFFEGFNSEIKDTFFFAFVIQFLLILMMYFHVGHGRYWQILFYSSIAGLCGAIIEHATVAYICQISELENYTKALPLLLNECFWIISEYSIPILNLIKMNTLATPKIAKLTKLVIISLAVPFSTVRLLIGWDRMINGYLSSGLGRELHGICFGIMALADIICTIYIIYFASKNSNNMSNNCGTKSVMDRIKNSNYTILILVDLVGLMLSILYIISTIFPGNPEYEASITLFHCLKSNFLLILAVDTLIFRYETANQTTASSHYLYNSRN